MEIGVMSEVAEASEAKTDINQYFSKESLQKYDHLFEDDKLVNEEENVGIEHILETDPLIIATSIRNQNSKGKFRSEYIISHLIMLSLRKLGIDGVAYLSKRIEDIGEDYAVPQMVNFAFPAFEISGVNKKYGTICECIEITKPANYEEFRSIELRADHSMINHSFFAKTYDEPGENPGNCIRISGRIVDYHNTGFYRFENHLCSMDFYKLSDKI